MRVTPINGAEAIFEPPESRAGPGDATVHRCGRDRRRRNNGALGRRR